jgi:hypothetical protein
LAELSQDERHFVDEATATLSRYLDAREFPPQIQLAYLAGFMFVIMAIGLPMGLLFAIPNYIHPQLAMWRVPGRDLLFYVSSPPTGILPLLFFLLALIVAAYFFIARRSDDFAEYAMKQLKTRRKSTSDDVARRFERRLVRLARKGKDPAAFDPRRFLIDSYRGMERPAFAITGLLGLATVALLANDFRSYTAFTPQAITTARWMGFVSESVPYEHVQSVTVVCHLTRAANFRARISYDVQVSPSASVGLFGEGTMRSLSPNRTKVDQKLAMAGVPFTYETFDHRDDTHMRGISRECADMLEAEYRPETRPVIRALIAAAIVES